MEWTLDGDGKPVRKVKKEEGLPSLQIVAEDVFLFEYLTFHKLLPPHMHLYLDGFRSELEKKVWENYNHKLPAEEAEFDLHDKLHVANFEEAFQAEFFPRMPGDKLGKPNRSWSRRNSVKVVKVVVDGIEKGAIAFYSATSQRASSTPSITLPMHQKEGEDGRELNPWIPFLVRCFVLFRFVSFCFVLFCFVLFCFVLFCFCFAMCVGSLHCSCVRTAPNPETEEGASHPGQDSQQAADVHADDEQPGAFAGDVQHCIARLGASAGASDAAVSHHVGARSRCGRHGAGHRTGGSAEVRQPRWQRHVAAVRDGVIGFG